MSAAKINITFFSSTAAFGKIHYMSSMQKTDVLLFLKENTSKTSSVNVAFFTVVGSIDFHRTVLYTSNPVIFFLD